MPTLTCARCSRARARRRDAPDARRYDGQQPTMSRYSPPAHSQTAPPLSRPASSTSRPSGLPYRSPTEEPSASPLATAGCGGNARCVRGWTTSDDGLHGSLDGARACVSRSSSILASISAFAPGLGPALRMTVASIGRMRARNSTAASPPARSTSTTTTSAHRRCAASKKRRDGGDPAGRALRAPATADARRRRRHGERCTATSGRAGRACLPPPAPGGRHTRAPAEDQAVTGGRC